MKKTFKHLSLILVFLLTVVSIPVEWTSAQEENTNLKVRTSGSGSVVVLDIVV